MSKLIDLTDLEFGRLKVLYRVNNDKNNKPMWLCKCSCGKLKNISGKSLRSGHTQSCGCLNNERISNLNKLNLTNQIFGFLKAIEPIEGDKNTPRKWKCQCLKCNNFILVETNKLTSGHTKSCGCLNISYGEEKIAYLLKKHKIDFVQEKTFQDLLYKETGHHPRFDFFVNNSYVIEFDGVQHFESNGGWNTEELVQKNKIRDKIKNEYCFSKNIPIIRIPYYILNDLTIKDLMLETSKYILEHSEEGEI